MAASAEIREFVSGLVLGSRIEVVLKDAENVRGALQMFTADSVTVRDDDGEERTLDLDQVEGVGLFTVSEGPE